MGTNGSADGVLKWTFGWEETIPLLLLLRIGVSASITLVLVWLLHTTFYIYSYIYIYTNSLLVYSFFKKREIGYLGFLEYRDR